MLREIASVSLEQTQLQDEQLTLKSESVTGQPLLEQFIQPENQGRVIGFESIFAQQFVRALGKTDRGIDYKGSCDCDAGPCINCNCNCHVCT